MRVKGLAQQRSAGAAIAIIGLISITFPFLPVHSQSSVGTNPLAMGASASASCNGCTSQTANLQVNPGDVVMAQVALAPQSADPRNSSNVCSDQVCSTLSSVTGTGLAFQQRMAYINKPTSEDETWAWEQFAIASTSGIVQITATVNDSAAWSMIVYAVSGANTSQPFDQNPDFQTGIFLNSGLSAPGDFNDCNLQDGCGLTFSTNAANTMVVFGLASEGVPIAIAPAGYAIINQNMVGNWITNAAAYALYSSPQTNTPTGSWGMTMPNCVQAPSNTCGQSAFWWVDAFQACSSNCPMTIVSSSSNSSSSIITTTATSTETVTATIPTTITQTATTTVTQPVTTTSIRSTTVTDTITSTEPPSATTITQTTTQIQTTPATQSVPLWAYGLMVVLLLAGLGAGYLIMRPAATLP